MNDTTITIREALADDAGVVAEIIRAAFEELAEPFGVTPDIFPRFPAYCQSTWVEKDLDNGVQLFLLETNGSAVGCVGLAPADGNTCRMMRLAVRPSYRHRGFGERLVRYVLGLARSAGRQQVTLVMIAENMPLRRWYESFGFTVTQVGRPKGLPFDVANMVLNLPAL